MNPEFFFPASATLRTVLVVFVFLCVAFDLILVRWLKIGKIAWKRVDYVWLGFAILGLIGSVAQVRIVSASAQLGVLEQRAALAFSAAKSLVDANAADPGAICRAFVRSEYSPPPDEFQMTQQEYDVACQWIKNYAKAIPSSPPLPITRIDQSTLPPKPNVTGGELQDIFQGLDSQIDYFNQRMDELDFVRSRAKNTSTELTIVFLGPFLLAVALALRITKVTGEVKLES